jgi:glycosyltransferase involved in cell wall biosynthesis
MVAPRTVLRFREKITRAVRILMIAPEPFFEPRGTPFSEFHRIRALTDLGHQVDLVTYPFGQDVTMPGLRVFRALRPPFLRGVKIGPSLAKLPLDAFLALSVVRRALSSSYDVIHSHEEGGLIGVVLAALLRVPHLYDMHSSLPQQLSNFAFSGSRVIRGVFLGIERFMIRGSRVVIVICPALLDTVRAIDPRAHVVLIENAPGSAEGEPTTAQAEAVRAAHGLKSPTPVVMYTGTFEAYQGLDLLFAAMAIVSGRTQDFCSPAASRSRSCKRGRRRPAPASRRWRSSPANARPLKYQGTSPPPTCWCRRAHAAPTHR